jgi:hypothetical protein
MPLMHDLKWDGSWWHTTFWNDKENRRQFVGRFKNKEIAKSARREAVNQAKSI